MSFNATRDSESGDHFLDISKTDKRLIRATIKTYEKTGSYIFLKLFKKPDVSSDDYQFNQRLGLTIEEFQKLVEASKKIQAAITNKDSESDSEEEIRPPIAKRPQKIPKRAKIIDDIEN